MTHAKDDLLGRAWELGYRVACRPSPPGTVKLPGALVVEILTAAFEDFLAGFDKYPEEAAFLAAVAAWAREVALDRVAKEREALRDFERYRHGGAHERNLDLGRLRPPPEAMDAAEWAGLDALLRPCGFAVLKSFRELKQEDKNEIYSKSLTDLYKPRLRDGRSPLDQIRVFEEVFPYFSRIVHLNAKQRLRKVRPEVGLDAVHVEPSDFQPGLTFSQIRFECQEALSEPEWNLITRKFFAGETDTDLIEDGAVLASLQIKAGLSAISRRRHLKDCLRLALEKLSHSLKESSHYG